MAEISVLFWDIGGVLLSNGWDHRARHSAAEKFGLDPVEFERRHEGVEREFETGRIDLDAYLTATVFYLARSFTHEDFRRFMHACSSPHPSALACARAVRTGGRYVMAALNNESDDLNRYRIETFDLRQIFHVFLSSCITGRRKPDPEAYRYALQITQRDPEEALLLDDRLENLESAARLGLRTLQVQDPERIREGLVSSGVVAG
ncbi:MAG: HAD family phosphatase [Thermoplasmata archaeon]|jgi:putative hydrolase of the HAD superfamily|nr:HAD family phosphatase [Thermoplasmata archaeon]